MHHELNFVLETWKQVNYSDNGSKVCIIRDRTRVLLLTAQQSSTLPIEPRGIPTWFKRGNDWLSSCTGHYKLVRGSEGCVCYGPPKFYYQFYFITTYSIHLFSKAHFMEVDLEAQAKVNSILCRWRKQYT